MIVGVAALYEGKLYSALKPARHDTIINMIWESNGNRSVCGEEQGFVTDSGHFVDRIQAIAIAIRAGQITEPRWPPLLYSEDLW